MEMSGRVPATLQFWGSARGGSFPLCEAERPQMGIAAVGTAVRRCGL